MPIVTHHDLPDGRSAARVELHSTSGVRVVLTNLGATLMRIDAPDRRGRIAPILLGHDDPARYPTGGADDPNHYLGATCGRYANRIAGAAFTIDGVHHHLAANEGDNQLHGGPRGFDHALWTVGEVVEDHVSMQLVSPDGDQGFPGRLVVDARFHLSSDGELAIRYKATTDRPTHVNIVSHGYFNLSGDPAASVLDHRLRLAADAFLPIDAAALPTGERRAVAGTPFDFRTGTEFGAHIDDADEQIAWGDGFNHNFVLNGQGLRPVAWLEHPGSGRTLKVATDQPGLQLYSGNALGGRFARRTGLCLEAQAWPDAPNQPSFPSTRLDPGQRYRSETRLRFGLVGISATHPES